MHWIVGLGGKGLNVRLGHFTFKPVSSRSISGCSPFNHTMNTIEEFTSITGASATEAENWLEMAGFVLADAVELFFSSGGQSGQPTDSSSGRSSDKRDLDQAYAGYDEEDEVRLPDQVKRQKLVDTDAFLGRRKRNAICVLVIGHIHASSI